MLRSLVTAAMFLTSLLPGVPLRPSRITATTPVHRIWEQGVGWSACGAGCRFNHRRSHKRGDAAMISPYHSRGFDMRFHVAFLKPHSFCYTTGVRWPFGHRPTAR